MPHVHLRRVTIVSFLSCFHPFLCSLCPCFCRHCFCCHCFYFCHCFVSVSAFVVSAAVFAVSTLLLSSLLSSLDYHKAKNTTTVCRVSANNFITSAQPCHNDVTILRMMRHSTTQPSELRKHKFEITSVLHSDMALLRTQPA